MLNLTPTVATVLLASLGFGREAAPRKLPEGPYSLPYHFTQHTNKEANAKRRAKRLLGSRQERRQRCRGYAAKAGKEWLE